MTESEKQHRQISDLILGEGFSVSSLIESSKGIGTDIEHRFEVSDGISRIGVVIILTELKNLAPGAAPKENKE